MTSHIQTGEMTSHIQTGSQVAMDVARYSNFAFNLNTTLCFFTLLREQIFTN